MPTFCARWPDGSFSIVGADDETDALIQLDELGDEPAEAAESGRPPQMAGEAPGHHDLRLRNHRRGAVRLPGGVHVDGPGESRL